MSSPLLATTGLLVIGTAPALGQNPAQLGNLPDIGEPAPFEIFPEMTLINGPSGLGDVVTGGNRHTGGCAWLDYNGDYLPDLFVVNGAGIPHRLYRNEGGGIFSDVSSLVVKPNIALESAGIACADFDNDGDTDVLIAVDNPFININAFNTTAGGPNLLYVNQGDGTFIEDAAAWGIVDPRGWRNISVNLSDIDRDGFVDAYMGVWAPNNNPTHDRTNLMYLNNGTVFTSFTSGAEDGLETLSALFFDADMDLYPDLYVANISAFHAPPLLDCTDHFYAGGPGGFYSLTTYPGIGDDACAPMGLDVGDIENDGDWDMYCTDIFTIPNASSGNHLYLGNPDGSLTDNVAESAGVLAADSWPCNFVDFDLDCWIDLWVGGGRVGQQDFIYMNERDGTFADRTPSSWLVGEETKGGAVADYDADGDVDVFVWNDASFASGLPSFFSYLFRNDTVTPYGYVQFKLLGVTSNRDAIDATVFVTGSGITQMRRVTGGDSAHSQSEQILSFGVGYNQVVDVEVRWPSGIVQNFQDVTTNGFHVIDESRGITDEDISGASARLDAQAGTITIAARSTYGGRTQLSAQGLGDLKYVAAETRFVGVFPVKSKDAPESIQIESARGVSRQVAVQRVR